MKAKINNKNKKFLGKKFGAKHRARELAIQFLYSLETLPNQDYLNAMELFLNPIENNIDSDENENESENENEKNIANDTPEVKAMCRNLVNEVHEKSDEIDKILLQCVTGWRPERMVSVDRAILKLIILECCINKTLPVKPAMSEAANLADSFGTMNSARFVNGVLSKAFNLLNLKSGE